MTSKDYKTALHKLQDYLNYTFNLSLLLRFCNLGPDD